MSAQMIYGRIAADGKTLNGAGFKSEKVGEGHYRITFKPPFQPPPAVVATQNNFPGFSTQHTHDNVIVGNVKSNSCEIKTGNKNGVLENREFSFIAMGPKAL